MTALATLRRSSICNVRVLNFLQNLCKTSPSLVRLESTFVPKRVLVVTKVSRYEIEKSFNPNLNENEFKKMLLERDINYEAVLAGHNRNKATACKTIETLQYLNIPYRIRNRYNIDVESIAWADLIVPVGGDGTFLLASNLIGDNTKPIVGINSDPEFSEGFLLLPTKYTSNIPDIFAKLKCGHFKYLMRSRIGITLKGENIWKPPSHMHEKSLAPNSEKFYIIHHNSTIPQGELPKTRKLPWLALNEVFIGESLSARISILHIKSEDEAYHKVKSSGICISTGTGSSSWYRAINSLNPQVVQDVLTISGNDQLHSIEDIKKVCYDFNSNIQFPADELKLSYVFRDMIVKHTWPSFSNTYPRGFCRKLSIRSQCYEGGLVIDGGISIHFNIGTTAELETLEENSLRNIVLCD